MPNTEKPTETRPDPKRPIPWHRVLEVPYAEKDVAKAAGARWDKESKRWYAPPDADLEKLSEWMITMLEVPYAEKDLAKAAGARWNRDAEFWFAPAAAELDKLEKWIVTVLDVPFAQKDLAKAAGARWNNDLKLWHAAPGADLTKLEKWLPGKDRTVSAPDLDTKQAILDVPYKEKDLAKEAGARWNRKLQLWYAPNGSDLEKLNKWIPTPARGQELLETAAKKRAEPQKPPPDAARVLDVPYKEKDLAKAAGARWHSDAGVWFIPDGADESKLANWKPTPERAKELLETPKKDQVKAAPAPTNTPVAAPPTPASDAPIPTGAEILTNLAITDNTLCAPPFRGRWFAETREAIADTVLFPHATDTWFDWSKDASVGKNCEEVSRNHESLSDGAERSFWSSQRPQELKRVVVVERALDALSYHQLNPDEHTLYLSTGGGPLSPEQKKTIAAGDVLGLLAHHPGDTVRTNPDVTVVAAFGNSKVGAQLARELKECLPADLKYERNAPTHGRHWNDALQAKEKSQKRTERVKPPSKVLKRSR